MRRWLANNSPMQLFADFLATYAYKWYLVLDLFAPRVAAKYTHLASGKPPTQNRAVGIAVPLGVNLGIDATKPLGDLTKRRHPVVGRRQGRSQPRLQSPPVHSPWVSPL